MLSPDRFRYELLIAKLDAYGFKIRSSRLIYYYLNAIHKDKYCMIYCQGQSMRHYALAIFFHDMFCFLEVTGITNYAGDTTPYSASQIEDFVSEKLKD